MRNRGLSASVEIWISKKGSYAFFAMKIIMTSQRLGKQLKEILCDYKQIPDQITAGDILMLTLQRVTGQ